MKDKIRKLLGKIMVRVYEVNQRSRYNVGFDFLGNANSIFVYYYPCGKVKELKTLATAYLDFADAIEKLEEILEKLNELEEK